MTSVDTPPEPPPLPADRRAWQFSLQSLMIGMTGFAIFCGLASALPMVLTQALLGIAWIAATGWLITGILFAKNDQRAFCIGAVVVASSMWTGIGGRFIQGIGGILRQTLFSLGVGSETAAELWLIHLALLATAIANGWFCIRARHYFQRHADD